MTRTAKEVKLECVIENGEPVLYVEVDGKRIAKRYSGQNWISLEPGYTVWGSEPGTDYSTIEDQVAELAAYLKHCPPLLKPLGRKRNQMSLAAMYAPKHRLFMELERAARKAHPECREIEIDEGVFEVEGPTGWKLVDWFKKNRPKEAARVERAFTKRLWAGS